MQLHYDINFNFYITSSLDGHLEFFDFNSFFFNQKLLSIRVNDAYFRSQTVKIYWIGYCTRKKGLFTKKKYYFGNKFEFLSHIYTGS